MELPTKVLIGEGVIEKLGEFVEDKGPRKTVISSGSQVTSKVRATVDRSLGGEPTWVEVSAADTQNVEKVKRAAKGAGRIVGVGGGKSVDVGKLAAFTLGLPFYSVPTSASHDGISSPFASLKGLDRPYSIMAKPPVGILADITVISSAPKRLLASGCGDLVSKLTAVKDWQLAHRVTGEYYGGYSASLALMSADVVLAEPRHLGGFGKDSVRDLVEALISTGVAAGIAGSSRPCSGSEHLFSHYLDVLAPGRGLHGEKCGIGTIMMAKLHRLDWRKVRTALADVGAPVEASAIGIGDSQVVQSLVRASSIRPDRYTILSKRKLDSKSAAALAKSTGVV
ncbi:MAG: iron-containing alcohol dehydrogenase [Nitrososphaerota archaeon]|nr:iron-containing alcohol dehydrogenase [Nitrososphaerota archaeon]MDG6942232.1 iron-containing alcohol dehydrogenase [Nitrososphaerota archaeon]MDG6942697.1 iron-containing alcohol dehydrogenase [Nitrososphaerota archaeon]MDG6948484.1 iron-containing alcohol dehydrogenase [Nitrososphaerota archaeon]MDG6950410.1 iron-containing alcohol dehydrogenase [Nitrososphaerota archaeon]